MCDNGARVRDRPAVCPDTAKFGEIYVRARNRYREGLPPLSRAVGKKVQRLIDDHIVSLGIDSKIPPISI